MTEFMLRTDVENKNSAVFQTLINPRKSRFQLFGRDIVYAVVYGDRKIGFEVLIELCYILQNKVGFDPPARGKLGCR